MRSRAGDYGHHAIAREFKEYNVRRMLSELSAMDLLKWQIFFKIENELINEKRGKKPLSLKDKIKAQLMSAGAHHGRRNKVV